MTIGSDPSEIVSRLEIRNEYLGLSNDGHLDQTYLRGDYAPTENIVFRLDVPLADGSSENLGSHFGMGDLILGGRGKLELSENLSWILGTNFILDTASNEVLGSGRTRSSRLPIWSGSLPGNGYSRLATSTPPHSAAAMTANRRRSANPCSVQEPFITCPKATGCGWTLKSMSITNREMTPPLFWRANSAKS